MITRLFGQALNSLSTKQPIRLSARTPSAALGREGALRLFLRLILSQTGACCAAGVFLKVDFIAAFTFASANVFAALTRR